MAESTTSSSNATKVFVPDEEAVWLAAEVLEADGKRVVVSATRVSSEESVPSGSRETLELTLEPPFVDASSLPLQNETMETGAEDMCTLDYLHEAGVLYNLRQRYFLKLPYTYTGSMCIAINPYAWLEHLYVDELRSRYLDEARDELPPHVYAISAAAYRGVSKIEDARWIGGDQSILVSGESGAGKTETVKIMMAHLASVSGDNDVVVKKVLQSQPLLESFGNAKTVRNDNSSRFGKFTQLEFSLERGKPLAQAKIRLVGSRCRTYLLEKSRVVHQAEGERTYHCFYGAARNEKARNGGEIVGALPALDTLRYVRQSDLDTQSIENVPDPERHDRTMQALELLGVDEAERSALERLLAAILFLGQLEFEGGEDSSRVSETSSQAATQITAALGVESAEALAAAMTERTMRARNEVYKVPLDVVKAADARDALAKEIYVRAFDWIVSKINASTSSSVDGAQARVVGLLDIFGFESFKINRFEQLCINYTNEKLQQKFTMDLFKTVQQEYDEERVPWTHIAFPDNAAVLQLIDGRMGVIDVLNEECVRPRGSDEGFVSKLNTLHASKNDPDARYKESKLHKDQFTVFHYAGQVTYTSTGWLERNNDTLQEDLAHLARQADFELLAHLFLKKTVDASSTTTKKGASSGTAGGGGRKRSGGSIAADTVSTKFKSQLSQLMEEIERTSVQYVRCVKPNTVKSSANFDAAMVVEQLRCAGVIEAIRVSRAGYPNKLQHAEFARRFAALLKVVPDASAPEKAARAAAAELLGSEISENEPSGEFAIGATRIYFKAGALEGLERRRATALAGRATSIQAAFRRFAAVRAFGRAKRGSVLLAAQARRSARRKTFLVLKAASIIAQSARRAVASRRVVAEMRRNDRATRIASAERRRALRTRYVKLRAATTLLGAQARRRSAVRAYVVALAEAKEQAKLENQLEAMQRKLQAMEEANKAMAAEQQKQQQQQEVVKVVTKEVVVEKQQARDDDRDDTSHEMIKLLQQLRADNDRLRKEAVLLRDENHALKRRVTELEAGQSMRMDWLAAARSTFHSGGGAAADAPHSKATPKQKKQATGGSAGSRRDGDDARPSAPTTSKKASSSSSSSSVSRFATIVSSLGFGGPSPSKSQASPSSQPAAAEQSGGEDPQPVGDKRRAPHIALPLNRFWQDVPAASLGGALPQKKEEIVLIHLKVGGQYLCATGSPIDLSKPRENDGNGSASPQQTAEEPRYLRCEPHVRGDGSTAGYRSSMSFRIERAEDESPAPHQDGAGELSRFKFRLKSEVTKGYVCVGGLFQRYCLVASAPTPEEASTFQFVSRRKPSSEDEEDEGDGLGTTIEMEESSSTSPSMERLRARQLLVALRVVDGPKASHFCRVRPDGYVNVAPPASSAAARGSLSPDDRTTPLLSVELLVPLSEYEITFRSSQLGLIVSKTMPLSVVRFKDSGKNGSVVPTAELSGRIGVGDVLTTADGRDLLSCTRREAVDIITSTRPIVISFRVAHYAQDLLSPTTTPPQTPIDLLTG